MLGSAAALAPRFQRAIHLRYDGGDAELIAHYIPSVSSTAALARLLHNTRPQATQGAHLLHAAYGSGKSHFGVALLGLLENDAALSAALTDLIERLTAVDPRAGAAAAAYRQQAMRLFPVVLSGSEGAFGTALLRGLRRALRAAELPDLPLQTRFDAAIQTLARWQHDYPPTSAAFDAAVRERSGSTIAEFIARLKQQDPASYDLFTAIYATLTAGAPFDPLIEGAPEWVYRDAARQLRRYGYSGIVLIWDEFGRYLEEHAAQAFGPQAAQLQDFAETCNHSSDDAQLHLILLTHKEMQGYAAALPQAHQQEWSRIAGRFQKHSLTTDPQLAYRLIAAALPPSQSNDPQPAAQFQKAQRWQLFGALPAAETRALIEAGWPLHPLALFALAQVSSRAAQNERTMFTFLTADEPHSLPNRLQQRRAAGLPPQIELADLWDYFADALRSEGGAELHKIWSGVANALDKVAADDALGQRIVKSLGILTVCAAKHLRPTRDALAWAVDAHSPAQIRDVELVLQNLRRRKALIHRAIDGYWSFIAGSDIDFEAQLQRALERANPTPQQLRHLLETHLPPPPVLARRYNIRHAMTRFFSGLYRWADELENVPWDLQLRQAQADGLVVYVLAADELEWQRARDAIRANPHPQVLHVLPNPPLLMGLRTVLAECFALQQIRDDPQLHQHSDQTRIQREIGWLFEDLQSRLQQTASPLIDPRAGKAQWLRAHGGQLAAYPISHPAQAAKIVSDVCTATFPLTPSLNSEGLNRRRPTAQQMRAAQTVIDALFAQPPSRTFGLAGQGPDVLALNSILKRSGILRLEAGTRWVLARPTENDRLAAVWDCIHQYLDAARQPTPLQPLVDTLSQPPYGMRRGIIPLLLGAVLRERIKVTTVWKGRSAAGAVTGALIGAMVEQPAEYRIKVGEWQPAFAALWTALLSCFDTYILAGERQSQPLAMMSAAMLRWLQTQPAFCRDTQQLSAAALEFRRVIRAGIREPAAALFEMLPPLILTGQTDESTAQRRIADLMQEISHASLDLQRRLDGFVCHAFAPESRSNDGRTRLRDWLAGISRAAETGLADYQFSSPASQDFVAAILSADESSSAFWDRLAEAVLGIALRDWNDESERRFYQGVRSARAEIEGDLRDLLDAEQAITFSIAMPQAERRDFRFRAADLSAQGQRILQNFKSTMQVAGRPLSVAEKRRVALAFMAHILGEELD